jgi:hypothetical protein
LIDLTFIFLKAERQLTKLFRKLGFGGRAGWR